MRAGFSLLLAILISSLLISVGLGVFNLALKGAIISAGSRESQYAIYAADTGIECALFWDTGLESDKDFGVGGAGVLDIPNYPFNISCGGSNTVEVTRESGGDANHATSTFTFTLGSAKYSTSVSVGKSCTVIDVGGNPGCNVYTIIQARGYNTNDINDPRRVERALQVTYSPPGS